MKNNVSEIPKCIEYINDCFDDIIKNFCITINYSDFTGPSPVCHVQKSYTIGKENVEYKYRISISKVKDKDSRFFLYKVDYYNDKYQTSYYNDNEFTIKNEGITPSVDEIILYGLIKVNAMRKSWLD